MKTVVAYVRVSTDGQCGEDKFGLEVQREMIKKYCAENDMNIVRWYADEGKSGAEERPGFDGIVYGEIMNPPVECVVVAKSDRVARDINIYYYYKMLLKKKGIELKSVSEDFGNMGVLSAILETFVVCVAQMERNNITQRTSSGRKAKAAYGGYSGGKPPLGYKVVNKRLVIDEEGAETVRRIFELREQGMTIVAIADVMNKENRKPMKAKIFYPSAVQHILKNKRLYEGYYSYGGSIETKGQHEAILKGNE